MVFVNNLEPEHRRACHIIDRLNRGKGVFLTGA